MNWVRNFNLRRNIIINNIYTCCSFITIIICIIISNSISDISFLILYNLLIVINYIRNCCTRIDIIRNSIICKSLTCQIINLIRNSNILTIYLFSISNSLCCIYWITVLINDLCKNNIYTVNLYNFLQFNTVLSDCCRSSGCLINEIIIFLNLNILSRNGIKLYGNFEMFFCLMNCVLNGYSNWIFFLINVNLIVLDFLDSNIVNQCLCRFCIR